MGGHQFYPTNTSAAKNRIPDTGNRKPDFPESRFSAKFKEPGQALGTNKKFVLAPISCPEIFTTEKRVFPRQNKTRSDGEKHSPTQEYLFTICVYDLRGKKQMLLGSDAGHYLIR